MIPEVTLHWVRWPSTIRINGDLSLHRWTQYAVYSINPIIVAGVPARALDLTKTKTRADRKALRGEPILFSGFHNNTRHTPPFSQLSNYQVDSRLNLLRLQAVPQFILNCNFCVTQNFFSASPRSLIFINNILMGLGKTLNTGWVTAWGS